MHPAELSRQTVAWNGISLQVPTSWYPTVVLDRYLLFAEESGPVCGLKWQATRGRFSPDSLCKKLGRRMPSARFQPWQPPPSWERPLAPCPWYGFQWQGEQVELGERQRGRGILLYLPKEQRTVALQWPNFRDEREQLYLQLLLSLRHHHDQAYIPWQLFDISARLPAAARLREHSFLPGRYSLAFTLASERLALLRFKPAAELLRNSGLGEFGTFLAGPAQLLPVTDPARARWVYSAGGAQAWLRRLRRQPTGIALQLRHYPEHNLILGVHVQGSSAKAAALLDSVLNHYHPG
ncbi:hypothetical protein [Desulfogranum mediterraneum]|uniref:hypothetical protein n=1 Tax=Desulfogranum mediterraneum TaxID=160661 RepID=UPI0004256921|nr:hypothetical protein [Desulfogranum mediterraneum]